MRIVWISDFDLRGAGYMNLSCPLCSRLVDMGHEIKAVGLGYKGQEHNYNFSIIPAENIKECLAITQNLWNLWKFDILIVALDIPLQENILQRMKNRPMPYIGIMPIESDPLCVSWAMVLMQMDRSLIISEFGTELAKEMGVNAVYIPIGIDTESWRLPEKEERKNIRDVLGFDEKDFVVLTVADNQERKNLSRSMEVFAEFAKNKPEAKYVLVTRKEFKFGWKIDDYAVELGILPKMTIFERGMPFRELWALYAASDAFLLLSKAEGLGMPVLEAMSVGIPVVGTYCTGIKELIGEDRGYGVVAEYDNYRDPFGNGKRYFASLKEGAKILNHIYKTRKFPKDVVKLARRYVEQRTWEHCAEVLDNQIRSVLQEKLHGEEKPEQISTTERKTE